jgi:hypothetical protein
MPAWLKLWYTWDLEETEFSQLVTQVNEQFAKGELQRPGEILHVAGMLLSLSDLGLISKNLVETLNDCRTYVDKIAARGVWSQEDVRSFLFPKFGLGDTYFNHGIYGTDLKEFKEFRAYLGNHMQRTLDKLLPSKAKDLLRLLAKDPAVFARNIIGHIPDDPIYHDTPIFKNVGPKEFIDVLLQIPNRDKRIIGKALGERYQIEQISRHLMGEKEFLMELKRLLEIEVQDSTKPLTAYILKNQVLNNIGSALATLENRESMDKNRGLTVPDEAKV